MQLPVWVEETLNSGKDVLLRRVRENGQYVYRAYELQPRTLGTVCEADEKARERGWMNAIKGKQSPNA